MAPIPAAALLTRPLEVILHDPTEPYATSSLTANLICRVVFAVLANLSCWVPFRHLYRHGEFAAVVFVCSVVIFNTLTIVNSLIWRNDNIEEWWRGHVWCDIHPYIYQSALAVYTTSVVAIMHNLAQQVGLLRAGPLTVLEKRRKLWIQALIIFPLPITQMAWIYPLAGQRYMIGTLKGCMWSSQPNWPLLVFFLLPTPILALIAGFYSILIFKRYMQIERSTRAALMSNTSAAARANRTRRRLFVMTLCILIPYILVICLHTAFQIRAGTPLRDFNFRQIHFANNPWPWHSILLHTYDQLTFLDVNSNYLPILTAVPIFIFFGATNDTKNTYRRYMLAMRLDKVFPKLRDGSRLGAQAQGSVGSWDSPSTITPAKSADKELCRTVHISQAPRGRCSVSSLPPPYSSKIESPVDNRHPNAPYQSVGDGMLIMPAKPEPCVTVNRDDPSTTEHVGFAQSNTLRRSSRPPHSSVSMFLSATGHPCKRVGTSKYENRQNITIPPSASCLHTRVWSDANYQVGQTSHADTWLPRLPPQPELSIMIQTHIALSSIHDQERLV